MRFRAAVYPAARTADRAPGAIPRVLCSPHSPDDFVAALTFHSVSAEDVRPLRHAVLRTGLPFATCIWDGDDAPDTRHFAARSAGETLAVATLLHRPHDLAPGSDAWQLRGMATAAHCRRQGIGAALLTHLLAWCRDNHGAVVWCNARSQAAPLYLRHGFIVVSDEFLIPGIGPHFVMRCALTHSAGD